MSRLGGLSDSSNDEFNVTLAAASNSTSALQFFALYPFSWLKNRRVPTHKNRMKTGFPPVKAAIPKISVPKHPRMGTFSPVISADFPLFFTFGRYSLKTTLPVKKAILQNAEREGVLNYLRSQICFCSCFWKNPVL